MGVRYVRALLCVRVFISLDRRTGATGQTSADRAPGGDSSRKACAMQTRVTREVGAPVRFRFFEWIAGSSRYMRAEAFVAFEGAFSKTFSSTTTDGTWTTFSLSLWIASTAY